MAELKTPLKDQKLFRQFCDLGTNRKDLLNSILKHESIPYTLLDLGGSQHFILYPENLVSGKECNVMVAHYDRVEGTPGANDNSASVFFLLFHARRLKEDDHNTIIIFTDQEELTSDHSIKDQGSYGLANYFRSKNIEHLNFFVFDMCGIGTTILLGTGGESLIKDHFKEYFDNSQIKKSIDRVKSEGENILLSINNGEFFYLNPLFSDDLGLILNRYPAVLISLLPYREAIEYKKDSSKTPKSWQCNHTTDDTPESLDNRAWKVINPILCSLSGITRDEEEIKSSEYKFNCYNQKIDSLYKNREAVKSVYGYIISPLFTVKSDKKRELSEKYLLFSSTIKSGAVNYISSILDTRTEDLSHDFYSYLKNSIAEEFPELPGSIKKIITEKAGENSIANFLYNNVIEQIESDYEILSHPIKNKSSIEIKFEPEFDITVRLYHENIELGTLIMIRAKNGYILNSGMFNPKLFLRFDPFNLLKGIRSLLIKWLKLNNINSLKINLNRYNWQGCDQLYRLLKMEMDGRSSDSEKPEYKYIWKRYNGKSTTKS